MSAGKTIQHAMDDFTANLNARHTQRSYTTPLRHFAVYLAGQGIHVDRDPVTTLSVDHAIGFVPWLRHDCFPDPDQPAKATLQLYLTAIYRFYRSLLKGGVVYEAADIARLEETYRDARNIRGEPRPKDPKLAAVEAIIQAARSVPPARGDKPADRKRELTRLRDIAIVETLRSTGCRVGELVALRRGDLDWLAHSALVKGKGSKYRKVYLDDAAWTALKVYLQARRDGGDARGLARLPVFCGHGNRSGRVPSRLTTRQVSRTIQGLAEKADIAQVGVTPHYFRHVFATRALERTENLALVQDMLGHASPATTRIYARTDEQQRRDGYARVWGESDEAGAPDMPGQPYRFEAAMPALDAERAGRGEVGNWDPRPTRDDLMHTAMAEIFWSTDCSLDELVSLRLEDVDSEAHSVRFVGPSLVERAARVLHLDEPAWNALSAYLQVRVAKTTTPTNTLFCDVDSTPLTTERADSVLGAAAAWVSIDEAE